MSSASCAAGDVAGRVIRGEADRGGSAGGPFVPGEVGEAIPRGELNSIPGALGLGGTGRIALGETGREGC